MRLMLMSPALAVDSELLWRCGCRAPTPPAGAAKSESVALKSLTVNLGSMSATRQARISSSLICSRSQTSYCIATESSSIILPSSAAPEALAAAHAVWSQIRLSRAGGTFADAGKSQIRWPFCSCRSIVHEAPLQRAGNDKVHIRVQEKPRERERERRVDVCVQQMRLSITKDMSNKHTDTHTQSVRRVCVTGKSAVTGSAGFISLLENNNLGHTHHVHLYHHTHPHSAPPPPHTYKHKHTPAHTHPRPHTESSHGISPRGWRKGVGAVGGSPARPCGTFAGSATQRENKRVQQVQQRKPAHQRQG